MPDRRVVVTGAGVVSALGNTAGEFWAALLSGQDGFAPIAAVDCSTMRFTNGGEARTFDPLAHFTEKQLLLLDRFAQFAVVAAREAVRDSGIRLPSDRTAIVTGSCVGGQNSMDEEFVAVYRKGLSRVNPLMIPRVMANGGASHISMEFGLTGPAFTVSTACSSSSHAIGQALWLLRAGAADVAIAGGSESVFSYGLLRAWEAMRVVSPDTCRPFSKDRRGLILGEGGAMLVLEMLDAAKARGARIYAELAGFGMTADAHHITQPSAIGAAQAMRLALADGGIPADTVGHINAHGTGTAANDVTETQAIKCVFRDHARGISLTSTKSMHGHALGASGAMEAIATVQAMSSGIVPPTANFIARDPDCDLDVVLEAREQPLRAALSNSFAFGGLNAALAFRSAP